MTTSAPVPVFSETALAEFAFHMGAAGREAAAEFPADVTEEWGRVFVRVLDLAARRAGLDVGDVRAALLDGLRRQRAGRVAGEVA